jgi:hypothetical protein
MNLFTVDVQIEGGQPKVDQCGHGVQNIRLLVDVING